jgi:predicted nucleic acid-binding Zn ribbon protein
MNNPLYKFINGKRVPVLAKKPCLVCGKLFQPNETKRKYCSLPCYYEMKRIRKDRVQWTDEMRKKLSKRYTGKGNPMYGIGVYKKGTKRPEIQGKNHPNWKGGFSLSQGYKIYESEGFTKGNKIAEHRLIMEQHLGRKLTSKELVHHINGIKTDNRIENLQVVDRKTHIKLHKKIGLVL